MRINRILGFAICAGVMGAQLVFMQNCGKASAPEDETSSSSLTTTPTIQTTANGNTYSGRIESIWSDVSSLYVSGWACQNANAAPLTVVASISDGTSNTNLSTAVANAIEISTDSALNTAALSRAATACADASGSPHAFQLKLNIAALLAAKGKTLLIQSVPLLLTSQTITIGLFGAVMPVAPAPATPPVADAPFDATRIRVLRLQWFPPFQNAQKFWFDQAGDLQGISRDWFRTGSTDMFANSSKARHLIYRCVYGDGRSHLLSSDPKCEGLGIEGPVGWVENAQSTNAPNALYRCLADTGAYMTSWNPAECKSLGYIVAGPLGFLPKQENVQF